MPSPSTSRDASSAEPGPPEDPRGWLTREIDRQTSQIAASLAEDPLYPYDQNQFAQDVSFELQFGRDRPAYVICEVQRMDDPAAPEDACVGAINEVP